MSVRPGILLLLSLAYAVAGAEVVRVADAEGLRHALSAAKAGTSILIAPGDYHGYFGAAALRGTEDQPIVIAAADASHPPVFRGAGECIHLTSVAHVILRDLVLTGAKYNGLNIDAGDEYASPSHHIILERLSVHDIGPEGNRDGIKLTWVDDLLVRDCTVERWGSGGSAIDMVGCRRGLVTGCVFRHTDSGASGVQVKGGSADVVIHGCRFGAAGQRAIHLGGCTAPEATRRLDPPCEARRVVAIGNTIVGSVAAVAFTGSDACVASWNTVYRPSAWAIRILQENRGEGFVPCRDGRLVSNLVVWNSRELRSAVDVRSATAPETFVFESNWWVCENRPAESQPRLPSVERGGIVGREPGLIIQDLTIRAANAPNHGAHSALAADEVGRIASKLCPWAFERVKGQVGRRLPAAGEGDQSPRGGGEGR